LAVGRFVHCSLWQFGSAWWKQIHNRNVHLQLKLRRLRSKGFYGLIQKDRHGERDRESDIFAWTKLHVRFIEKIRQQLKQGWLFRLQNSTNAPKHGPATNHPPRKSKSPSENFFFISSKNRWKYINIYIYIYISIYRARSKVVDESLFYQWSFGC